MTKLERALFYQNKYIAACDTANKATHKAEVAPSSANIKARALAVREMARVNVARVHANKLCVYSTN